MTYTDITTTGLEVILLWRRPGVDMEDENLTGAVAPGTEVEVLNRKKYKDHWFVKCKCMVIYKGEEYPQIGWCMDTLLENRGIV